MDLRDFSRKILAIAELLNRWGGVLGSLDQTRRNKVADYADEIAATLARAARSAIELEKTPENHNAARELVREFGRIQGYLETLVGVLQHHLDGRKLAGVKRRLEQLGPGRARETLGALKARARADRLVAAEGYFRALADSLRA